ncbi:hypothetical protein RUND412_002335 [Rhizina undulata]
MPFPRSSPAVRALLRRSIPSSAPRITIRRMTQNSAEGGSYASTGKTHYNHKTSDLPWIIGSLAVTLPSAAFLLSGESPKPHKPLPKYDPHDKSTSPREFGEKTAAKETAPKAEEPTPKEEQVAASDEAKATQEPISTEKEGQDIAGATFEAIGQALEATGDIGKKAGELSEAAKNKAEASIQGVADVAAAVKEMVGETIEGITDESKKKADEAGEKAAEIKGEVSEKVEKMKETAEEKVEAKGEDKSRSQKLQELNQAQTDKAPSQTDPPSAAFKEIRSMNEMSGKQEGLSNADTWHPILHDERGQAIAKKSEGPHESAKLKGTVDPNRSAK